MVFVIVLIVGSICLLLSSITLPARAVGLEAWVGAPRGAAATGVMLLDEASDRQVKWGVCVTDAHQAAFYLATAGAYVRFATLDCPNASGHEDRLACAVDVTVVIACIAWTTAYLAATVNSCGTGQNVEAACASALAASVGACGEFAFLASAVVEACKHGDGKSMPYSHFPLSHRRLEQRWEPTFPGHSRPPSPAEAVKFFDWRATEMKLSAQRLNSDENAEGVGEEEESIGRGARTAQCFVDANLALGFMVRVGLQIYYLNRECPSQKQEDLRKCTLDVLLVISSFAWVVQFLAQLLVDCPDIAREQAACAAVISDFVAIAAALGPIVNGVTEDCPDVSLASVNRTATLTLPLGYAGFA